MLLYPSQYFFHLSPVITYWLSATVLIVDWAVITQGTYGILWPCLYTFLWLVHWREPKLCKCSTVGCFSFRRGFVCREANQHHLLPLPVSRPQPRCKIVSIHAEVFTANVYFLSGSQKMTALKRSQLLIPARYFKSKHTWLAFQSYLRS